MRSYILSTSEYSTKAYNEKLARVYPYITNFILNIWVMNISCSFFMPSERITSESVVMEFGISKQ